jgi:hypothetical protein
MRHLGGQVASQKAGDQLIHPGCIPPAIHKGLADPQGSPGQDALEYPCIVYGDIPVAGAADLDVYEGEQARDGALRIGG